MRRSSETTTTCRIERKRAHDREAQRASRAKTKAYITHLENIVADLSESTGGSRANYLAEHASKQAQEIDNLQGLVSKIRGLVQDHTRSEQSSSPRPEDPRLKLEGSSVDSAFGDGGQSNAEQLASALNWDDSPNDDHDPPEAAKRIERETPQDQPVAITSTRNLIVMGISLLCQDDDCTYFAKLNEVISKVEQTPDNLSTLEEDQDILIRAILHGWDAAERVHHFDIVWRFLRAHDEGLWYRTAPLERAAHFWQMRNTMLHKIKPKNQERRATTPFMAPTEGQRNVSSYPPAIDYFGWPQVRDQMIKEGIKGCPGKTIIAYAESFRFVWPYEFRDVYKVNRSTGMYSFSEGFLKSWNDLSCFRMVQNNLIPYYAHPSLAQALPQPTFARAASLDDSDDSGDEEYLTKTAALVGFPAMDAVVQDQSIPDWITSFNMEISGDPAQSFPGSFSMGHDANIPHWPGL